MIWGFAHRTTKLCSSSRGALPLQEGMSFPAPCHSASPLTWLWVTQPDSAAISSCKPTAFKKYILWQKESRCIRYLWACVQMVLFHWRAIPTSGALLWYTCSSLPLQTPELPAPGSELPHTTSPAICSEMFVPELFSVPTLCNCLKSHLDLEILTRAHLFTSLLFPWDCTNRVVTGCSVFYFDPMSGQQQIVQGALLPWLFWQLLGDRLPASVLQLSITEILLYIYIHFSINISSQLNNICRDCFYLFPCGGSQTFPYKSPSCTSPSCTQKPAHPWIILLSACLQDDIWKWPSISVWVNRWPDLVCCLPERR